MRKSYSAEFKTQVVLQLLREEKSVSELAAEHGVHPNQLHKWRRTLLERLPEVFTGDQKARAERAEHEQQIEALYTEIGRLSTQLAWLKKKGIWFE